MKTFHIEAEEGQIAKTVLMPGDPMRAKYIAEHYLTDVICYSQVRGMNGYTGYYNGKKVSVQGSGMGIPSMGIYSYELFNTFGVDQIIRVGTCGAVNRDVEVGSLILAMGCCSNSNLASAARPRSPCLLAKRASAPAAAWLPFPGLPSGKAKWNGHYHVPRRRLSSTWYGWRRV